MIADTAKKACRFRQAFLLLIVLVSASCGGVSPLDSRLDGVERIARTAQMTPLRVQAGPFELFGLRRFADPATGRLTVYIEGDGLAWNAFGTAPNVDPTPRDPVALRLAAIDRAANRLYLARPCQYQTDAALARCGVIYWTSHRLAEEVVAAVADVVRRQALLIGARRIRLVGYSGGGALAALLVPRLDTAVDLVTIAAPLDHAYWTHVMQISPMSGSLNPADIAGQLANVPQAHIVSTRDRIVPASVAERFVAGLGPGARGARILRTDRADHHCCWPEIWPELLTHIERIE